MDLVMVFLLFALCMAGALALNVTMLLPLGAGFCLFALLSVRRGFSLRQVLFFAAGSFRDSFIVVRILLLIGCLTGVWRQSGTIAYFVTLGVSLIPPRVFLLAVFLLSAMMSYAIGTSFGVTATAGVILITIARAGGVDPVLAAGAILSGVYVGDRGSPAASSANLVAVLTHTDMRDNVRQMLKTSLLPFFLCCAAYGGMSLLSPAPRLDTDILDRLAREFQLTWYCLLPAVLMIVLPFCGVKVRLAMGISLLCSVLVALFVQKTDVPGCLRAALMGYQPGDESLSGLLSGGGVLSMLEVCGILLLSGTYGGIFRGTGLMDPVHEKIARGAEKIGRFPMMLVLGVGVCALFCNQTIGVIMLNQLSASLYGDHKDENRQKMLDMENSVILVAGLVPWCIASSVPLSMLGADVRSLPAALYLWLVPLCYFLAGKLRKSRA